MALAGRVRSGISLFKTIAVSDSVSSARSFPSGRPLIPALRDYATASAQKTGNVKVPVALVGESGNFASWLYIAAVKMNSLEKIESDLSELVEAMKTSPIFSQFTKDPSVPRETRLAAIVDVCDKAKFAEPTKNFLSLLAENGKLKTLDVIVKKFMQLTTAHRGDVKVLVTTVMPLPPAEEKELKETLQEKDTAPFLPSQIVSKEASRSAHFPGFTKVKNVYITGHSDGSIGVWDMSCPFLVPVLFLKEQADQDISSRGTAALTALHFDSNSRLLVSGDQNGMVRLYRFKPEPYLTENSFIPFQGSSKKGNNHIVHSVKHIKLTGSITCIQKSQNSKHLAIGSDQGHVSLVDVEEATVLYTKHIASDICPGITSLQFESCSVQGFEKNVLVVAMRDSSVFSLDSDTGNMIGTNMVKPKKPFKALFMQILDGKQDSSGNGESIVEDVSTRQPSVLLCSEKAIYIYPLSQVVQGVKKVLHKKKFSSPSICSASTFYGTSGVGLILVFSDGTVEIRSLPELSLLKQISIRGFTYSSPKQNSLPEITISASWDGDLVMVNGDDELIVSSVLPQKETFRLVESLSRVYKKDNAVCQDGTTASAVASSPKEKKGMFGSVFKTKPKRAADTETTESTKETIEELSKIFTTANFPWNNNVERSRESNVVTRVGDEEELDIDDIDIEDDDDHQQQELPKEQGILSGISKQKLASKFTSFKGKLKQMTAKNEKSVEEKHEEKRGASIDQIKKKYGFASSSEEMGAAKMAQSKLQDNLKKLQGISLKTTEMEDTAKSFSSTAKELLNAVEFNKQSSKT